MIFHSIRSHTFYGNELCTVKFYITIFRKTGNLCVWKAAPFINYSYIHLLMAQMVKNLPAMWETWVPSLSWEDPREKEAATHSRILAWRIPWTEEHGRLQSMVPQRVGHDWVTWTFTSECSGWKCGAIRLRENSALSAETLKVETILFVSSQELSHSSARLHFNNPICPVHVVF